MVRRGKFRADRVALAFLARAMSDRLAPWVLRSCRRAVVVSVPMHPRKRRRRGLDQAAVLAELSADRLGLRYQPRAMARLRETLPQGDVRVTSRAHNVRDAFCVRCPSRLQGRVVVLIDDVRTSGSTALECARVLRSAGVRRIALLTAAQA